MEKKRTQRGRAANANNQTWQINRCKEKMDQEDDILYVFIVSMRIFTNE